MSSPQELSGELEEVDARSWLDLAMHARISDVKGLLHTPAGFSPLPHVKGAEVQYHRHLSRKEMCWEREASTGAELEEREDKVKIKPLSW